MLDRVFATAHTLRRIVQQAVWIPAPSLTEASLPDQAGRVHLVTGGYAGVGHELARMLYARNATVYVAGRSRDKALASIAAIKAACPRSAGRLEFLALDLADLASVAASARDFLARERRLDVLTNNAGVMVPPLGSRDALGHELQMGTNCLGPFLFTACLMPLLKATAAAAPPGSVRVTWAASSAIEMSPAGGVQFDAAGAAKCHDSPPLDYAQSKAANVFLAAETARRHGRDAIVSVAWNPGNLKSDLQRHVGGLSKWLMDSLLLYAPTLGACTELYAGWSDDISQDNNGAYVIPWGRLGDMRPDLVAALKSSEDGGTGTAARFWDWCEETTKPYA